MSRIPGLAVAAILAFTGAACSDDPSAPAADAAVAPRDAGAEPECYPNPTTHREIINACTRAQHVDKTPVLPLLNADGTLPPLP